MIVYLHGFSSGAGSSKAKALKEALAPARFLVPDYPSHRPHAAVRELTQFINEAVAARNGSQVMLIGSSLGGYYAQYLAAKLDVIDNVVLINPALQPQLTLRPCIGHNTNMVTGQPFEFREQDIVALARYDMAQGSSVKPTLVLVDEGDEVIDYRDALRRYEDIGHVIVYPGGSHRFEHVEEAATEIALFYRENV
jgi:predicted esterase YcpF (UPF0227 family)